MPMKRKSLTLTQSIELAIQMCYRRHGYRIAAEANRTYTLQVPNHPETVTVQWNSEGWWKVSAASKESENVYELVREGTYPGKDPSPWLLTYADRVAPQPPKKPIQAKGGWAQWIASGSMLTLLLSLVKVLIVSAQDGLTPTFSTARTIITHTGLEEVPSAVAGSFLNLPVASLLLLSALLWLIARFSLPRVTFREDLLTGRAIPLVMIPLVALAVAFVIGDLVAKILIFTAVTALLWFGYPLIFLNHSLTKWQRKARLAILYSRGGGPGPTPAFESRAENQTTDALAEAYVLEESAQEAQRLLWHERDDALDSKTFMEKYSLAQALRIGSPNLRKARQLAGAIQADQPDPNKLARHAKWTKFRIDVWAYAPLVAVLTMSLFLILDSRPWQAPVCITHEDGDRHSAYVIASDPWVLMNADTRELITDDIDFALQPDRCPGDTHLDPDFGLWGNPPQY